MIKQIVPAEMFDSPKADDLEEKRRLCRETAGGKPRRIVYDCDNTRVTLEHRVLCKVGRKLHPKAKDGSLPLISVLRGVSAAVCRICKYCVEAEVTA